jgi:uncharacterized membrane-anchored protein
VQYGGNTNVKKSALAAVAAALPLLVASSGHAAGASADTTPTSSALPASDGLASLHTPEGREKFVASLNKQTGVIPLPGANAQLDLGTKYYFVGSADARRIIEGPWGNPKGSADGVMGMVFPTAMSPLDPDGWGAVVTYLNNGYVTDKDARSTDYGKVLDQLREGEDQDNEERKKQGFAGMHLAGWGQPPSYDAAHHALIWARDIKVDDQKDDTLNYDVRVLGRKGVFSLNIVSTMSALPQIRTAAADLEQTASFTPGNRYADFKPGSDKTAEYGLAGLILAGAGLAVAKKVGLIAVALLFLKKGIAIVVAAGVAVLAWLRRMFGGKKKPAT